MNFLRSISRGIRSFSSPHPLRDWFVVLGALILLFLVFLSIAVYYFFGVRSGSIVGTEETELPRAARISRDDLEKTVAVYEMRRTNYDAGNFNAPDVSDPSR